MTEKNKKKHILSPNIIGFSSILDIFATQAPYAKVARDIRENIRWDDRGVCQHDREAIQSDWQAVRSGFPL